MALCSRLRVLSLTFCCLAVYLLVLPAYSQHHTVPVRVVERDLPGLPPAAILAIPELSDPSINLDSSNPNSHLSKILIPRTPGTENNTFVRKYIVSTLRALDWDVEEDSFTDDTPYGRKTFTNVIATKNPEAPRRVALSAHFDSKFFSSYPQNQFVGATDSAAPCALMLDLAQTLDPLINARAKRIAESDSIDDDDDEFSDVTLQLIFFDGEEAFKDWTATDSIYGARHLANKWSTTYLPPHPKRRLMSASTPVTPLSTLDHLILLDLLGAANPTVRSFFADTAWLFDILVRAEDRLHDNGVLSEEEERNDAVGEVTEKRAFRSFFMARDDPRSARWGSIGDDHVPFLRGGVSILHVITEPFPKVWHTLQDDATALDLPTLRRWNLILRVFFCEYLGLDPLDASPPTKARSESQLEGATASGESTVRRSDSELVSMPRGL